MEVTGSRGLIRVARNPECEVQTAMVAERANEITLYEAIAGAPYPGEYGERVAARRRGAQFEQSLYRNDAAELRRALAERYGYDAEALVVRNLAEEVPGRGEAVMARRWVRTRQILQDWAAGRPAPNLLIQPQLALRIEPRGTEVDYVTPDLLFLPPGEMHCLPGELKSIIARDGVVDPPDRDLARRQAAVQLVALRQILEALGASERARNRAVFVYARPEGLRAARPEEEDLEAEVYEAARAISAAGVMRSQLRARRGGGPADLAALFPELRTNYTEWCVSGCALARICRDQSCSTARVLGDAAAEVFGADMDQSRLLALLSGAAPASPREERIAALLRGSIDGLGLALPAPRRVA